MNKYGNYAGALFVLLMLLLLIPQSVAAEAKASLETFCFSGSGSMLLSPPGWEGFVDCGSLDGGYFTIFIDDMGWPTDDPGTPENERWDFIVASFFSYVPEELNEHWEGWIPIANTPAPPVILHYWNNGNNFGGAATLNFTIIDKDKDGVMDSEDLMTQAFAANFLVHIEQGTGVYEGKCGPGSMNGTIEDFDPTPMDIFTASGRWIVRTDCTVPTEHTTWGAVKSLYAE